MNYQAILRLYSGSQPEKFRNHCSIIVCLCLWSMKWKDDTVSSMIHYSHAHTSFHTSLLHICYLSGLCHTPPPSPYEVIRNSHYSLLSLGYDHGSMKYSKLDDTKPICIYRLHKTVLPWCHSNIQSAPPETVFMLALLLLGSMPLFYYIWFSGISGPNKTSWNKLQSTKIKNTVENILQITCKGEYCQGCF